MGIFSKFENKMEDGLEGAAGKIFNAPISPVQISKKAEKAMKREKMVGAGKQYAPTLYTILVNAEDDEKLFGYYPTLAGETETFLSAKAAQEGLTMDGQPLVRFIVDESLKRGKFDVVAELVSAPIVAQLRREEMHRYGLAGKKESAAPSPQPSPAPAAPAANAPAYTSPNAQPAVANVGSVPQRQETPTGESPKKEPLPYVPESEIDRSIDYGEYTFNSQDFEDYEKHGPSAQLINPPSTPSQAQDAQQSEGALADLSGFDVETFSPSALDSRDFGIEQAPAAPAVQNPAPQSAIPAAAENHAPVVNTHVFQGGGATQQPSQSAVRARLINTATNTDYDLVGGRLILGRSRTCDITIDDINISRNHAELRFETQGVWVLTDLGSTNGTKVNGQSISSSTINSGDRITIGTTDLIFLEG